ncbi:proline-rich protein HaeIII subfamily 1-like [Thalassophryne amazonica]|uniref:proline-rich protein HaeIII subfamily 1-like n=1 Tax=Thalassophryne amazonica TaxID=390379 RepID=UPI001470B8E7|nr:proline-rich protein HaeIII subfamily 1-like [Thalassophryne amazonica]
MGLPKGGAPEPHHPGHSPQWEKQAAAGTGGKGATATEPKARAGTTGPYEGGAQPPDKRGSQGARGRQAGPTDPDGEAGAWRATYDLSLGEQHHPPRRHRTPQPTNGRADRPNMKRNNGHPIPPITTTPTPNRTRSPTASTGGPTGRPASHPAPPQAQRHTHTPQGRSQKGARASTRPNPPPPVDLQSHQAAPGKQTSQTPEAQPQIPKQARTPHPDANPSPHARAAQPHHT